MPTLRKRVVTALGSAALVMLLAPAPGAAQTSWYFQGGAQYTTTMLEDEIVDPIEVNAGIGPVLTAGVARRIGDQAQAGLELGLSMTPLEAEEEELTRDLGNVTSLSALATLSGRLTGPLGWRVGLGGIKYLGGSDAGFFQDGYPTRLLVGGGLDYTRPAFTGWDFMISARFDNHRFTTETLDRRGFANAHGVNRLSVSAGLRGGAR